MPLTFYRKNRDYTLGLPSPAPRKKIVATDCRASGDPGAVGVFPNGVSVMCECGRLANRSADRDIYWIGCA